ncbi:MAG: hypothetical protein ACXWFX_03480 [Methylobacter sp.]
MNFASMLPAIPFLFHILKTLANQGLQADSSYTLQPRPTKNSFVAWILLVLIKAFS